MARKLKAVLGFKRLISWLYGRNAPVFNKYAVLLQHHLALRGAGVHADQPARI